MSLLDDGKQLLQDRASQYRDTFPDGNPAVAAVLKDLAKFCRAHESTFHPDHAISDRLDGRREVYLRIMHHLNLSADELWARYGNPTLPKE